RRHRGVGDPQLDAGQSSKRHARLPVAHAGQVTPPAPRLAKLDLCGIRDSHAHRRSCSSGPPCAIVGAHAQQPRPSGWPLPARSRHASPGPGRGPRPMSALHALRLLGRQARWALPAGALIGVALPDLATALRPLLTAAVIGTLTATLLRLDWDQLA